MLLVCERFVSYTEGMIMKSKLLKLVAFFTLAVMMVASVTGCAEANSAKSDKLQIVCTIFPEYDWVKEIIGADADWAEVSFLLDSGVDLHSYQPTSEDMAKISECDVFIYVGGESDGWVDDALAEATNKDMVVINLLESLGDSVKEEEIVEGMEAEEEGEEEEEGPEYDEHVWLSLKNAQTLVSAISDKLSAADPDHKDTYKKNADAYNAKLAELDAAYADAVSGAAVKTLVFGDRFPFRYMVDDYGLKYYAAFVGCSAESEASFETVIFLAGKVDEEGISSVCKIESGDGKLAQTIIDNTKSKDQKVVTFDSLQSTMKSDIDAGVTYLSVMEKNLAALKDALGTK